MRANEKLTKFENSPGKLRDMVAQSAKTCPNHMSQSASFTVFRDHTSIVWTKSTTQVKRLAN